MKIEDLKVEMKVRVNRDVSLSERRYGYASLKTKLAGTVQSIRRISPPNRIYINTGDSRQISYHRDDLSPITIETDLKSKIKPVTFDLKDLYLNWKGDYEYRTYKTWDDD